MATIGLIHSGGKGVSCPFLKLNITYKQCQIYGALIFQELL
jgi:hypothetical protein